MTLQGGSFLAPVAIRAKLNNEGRLVYPGSEANRKREIFRLSRLRMGNRILSCTSRLDTDRARSQYGVGIGAAASDDQHGSEVLLY
jgi:hypothetical protein